MRFLVGKGNQQNFSFRKMLRNFETLNLCQDLAWIRIPIRIRENYFRSDPDPGSATLSKSYDRYVNISLMAF